MWSSWDNAGVSCSPGERTAGKGQACAFRTVVVDWAINQSHMGNVFAFPAQTAVRKLLYNKQKSGGKF